MKDVIGYEGLYQIDECGNIKSLAKLNGRSMRNELILKPQINNKGYYIVQLSNNNIQKGYAVHRLVAIHYIPNPDNLPEVNHLDGNPLNVHVSNLEWCSRSENMLHRFKIGLTNHRGIKNPRSKLTEEQVKEIRAKYVPHKYSLRKLAKEYDVNFVTISYIINNKNWNTLL